MPRTSTRLGDPLADGLAALENGRWEEARVHFERSLALAQTPEALEGLSWAAWWLDDADTVFDARGRAYRSYRKRGDMTAAARMATWLACDQLDFRGAVRIANGWLARARRLLDRLDPGPEHGWLTFFEGYMAAAAGDAPEALRLARQAAETGRTLGVPDIEMLGLALEGAGLVAAGEVADGMRCLDEATTAALEEEAEIPIAGAWTCCFLVSACSQVRDYERAFEWCGRIAEFAARYGSRYMLAFCRTEYGAVHLWRGEWGDAEAVLEAAVDDFSRSRPAMAAGPVASLAELRRRQGRPTEATRLLEEAGPSAQAQLCRARLALDVGDALRAIELAQRLLRQTPEDQPLARVPVVELLVLAHAARGELDEARAALGSLREIERRAGTGALRASADLAEGVVAAAAGEHDRARALFEDAIDGFERSNAPFEAALGRAELATSLIALGRDELAGSEATAAYECMCKLGAVAGAARARSVLAVAERADRAPLPELTPRERDVLALVAEGLTNRQIAERLVVSDHTVHRHVTNILRKLDLPSRTAAAARAVSSGLLTRPHA